MRLRAQNSSCEVIVVRVGDAVDALSCAGLEMAAEVSTRGADAAPDGPSIELGKRYVDDDDLIEILCTKPGVGPLAVGGRPLAIKAAKPLPSSD